jgi:hypothetical protein
MMTDPELMKVGRMIQSIDQLMVGLHANMRVCKALSTFYRSELFQDRELKKLKPEWITQSGGAPQRRAKNVASSLMSIHHQTNNMLERATVVHLMGTKRQDMVQRQIDTPFHLLCGKATACRIPRLTAAYTYLGPLPQPEPQRADHARPQQDHPERLEHYESLFQHHARLTPRVGRLCTRCPACPPEYDLLSK